MGFTDVAVADGRAIATGFSFFVVYARTPAGIDVSTVRAPSATRETLAMDQVDELIAKRIGRKLKVAGACIGTDAHTVGSTRSST